MLIGDTMAFFRLSDIKFFSEVKKFKFAENLLVKHEFDLWMILINFVQVREDLRGSREKLKMTFET